MIRPIVLRRLHAASLLLVLAVATSACGRVEYRELQVGECLPAGAGVEGRRAAAPLTVSCERPHLYEVLAIQTLEPPDDAWPGEELLDLNAKAACAGIMPERLGFRAEELPDGVLLVYVTPSERSWVDEADRQVECLLKYPDVTTDTLVRAGR